MAYDIFVSLFFLLGLIQILFAGISMFNLRMAKIYVDLTDRFDIYGIYYKFIKKNTPLQAMRILGPIGIICGILIICLGVYHAVR